MVNWPRFMVIAGVVLMLNGLFMDTTVSTGLGQLHNIGLLQRSQNLIAVGGILLVAGLIWGQGSKSASEAPDESASNEFAKQVEEAKKIIHEAKNRNKHQWEALKGSIPRDRLALRVVIALITGIVLFLLVLTLFDLREMSFWKFMFAFAFLPTGFIMTLRKKSISDAAMPVLAFLCAGLLIFWGGVFISVAKEQGNMTLIGLVPLVVAHFSFRRFNTGLTSRYLLKFVLMFLATVLVIGGITVLALQDI